MKEEECFFFHLAFIEKLMDHGVFFIVHIKMPQFCAVKTPEQMAQESKIATMEGMKDIAQGLASKKRKINEDFYEACSTSDSQEEALYNTHILRRSNRLPIVRAEKNLQERIHYLTLDLTNATVALDDKNTELVKLQEKFNIYIKIEDELAILGNMNLYLKNLDSMTADQIAKSYKLFMEDSNEHLALCGNYIEKIEYSFIKKSLERVLKAERYRMHEIECKIVSAKQWRVITDISIITVISILIILVSILLTDYLMFRVI